MRFCFVLFYLLLSGTALLYAQTTIVSPAQMDSLDNVRILYIRQYASLALREMQRSGIPASITLAQAVLETSAGNSLLAREANNHFGLKCGPHWQGTEIYKHDDEYTDDGGELLSCFRGFETVAESYAAHTDFLLDPQKYNRYGDLFSLPPTDYLSWAKMLQKAGYSGAGHYATRLVEYIERYRLYELDHAGTAAAPEQRRIFINETPAVLAYTGETLQSIAEIFGLDVDALAAFNEYGYKPDQRLTAGSRIFLRQKPAQWTGGAVFHFANGRQTVFELSQAYGIRLSELRRLNGLTAAQEPAQYAKIRLRGRREPNESVKIMTRRYQMGLVVENEPDIAIETRQLPPMRAATTRRLNAALQALAFAPPAEASETIALTEPAQVLFSQNRSLEPEADETVFHVVESGDTLFSIARKYGLSTTSLKNINQLAGNTLQIGQLLRISK